MTADSTVVLSVPELDDDVDALTAALAYAKAGWYVGPVKRAEKNPGALLGKSWHTRTSRDPATIVEWFAGTDHGVFLHAGRSGAVIFDVDDPDRVPKTLANAFETAGPPAQATRRSDIRRGHALFRQPAGRSIGNGTGALGKSWGEVRGANGVIVVAPSVHAKAADGGFYAWRRTGLVPELPPELAAALPDATQAVDAAGSAEVAAFLDQYVAHGRPLLLRSVLARLDQQIADRASRHDSARDALCQAAREARAGCYPARDAIAGIRQRFEAAVAGERRDPAEWTGLVAWAVAQARLDDPEARRAEIEARTSPFVAEPPPDDDPPDDFSDPGPDPWAGIPTVGEQTSAGPAGGGSAAHQNSEGATEPPRPATGLVFQTFAELSAEVDAAGPRTWMLRGLWPHGDYGVHAAEHKAQKTWNAIDMIVSVASGTPWLGAIPVDRPGPVVMFVGEGGKGNTVRRIRAIAEHKGIDAGPLPIHVCARAPHLGDDAHMAMLAAKIEEVRPSLVTIDPLYLSAAGGDLKDLYSMGTLLERPQLVAQAFGASLLIVHHFNRQQGGGSGRISGAGPAEWGRVLMTAAVKSKRTDPNTRATDVVTELTIIGGEIADRTLRIHRTISSDDPDSLDAPLRYSVAAHDADDDAAAPVAGRSAEDDLPPATRKLLTALRNLGKPSTVREIVDQVAVEHGHGLKRETASRSLTKLADLQLVDSVDSPGRSTIWRALGAPSSESATTNDL